MPRFKEKKKKRGKKSKKAGEQSDSKANEREPGREDLRERIPIASNAQIEEAKEAPVDNNTSVLLEGGEASDKGESPTRRRGHRGRKRPKRRNQRRQRAMVEQSEDEGSSSESSDVDEEQARAKLEAWLLRFRRGKYNLVLAQETA
jgi:hypothetical protein